VWLVLCHDTDAAARWAAQELRRRGLQPLELITAETLALGTVWRSRIGSTERAIEIRLSDGRVIDSRRVRGTINRLQWVPAEAVQLGTPTDQAYALQELYAFYMGWLYSLPRPILNPPTPQGLSGRWRYPSEWAWLAGQAGLAVQPLRITPATHEAVAALSLQLPSPGRRRTILVLDGEVIGDAPTAVADGVEHLWALADTPLLGVEFDLGSDDSWIFAGVSVSPDLRSGGDALLDRLEIALRSAA
jgi:hypothetical protein